ncbi:protein YABBY 2-like [Euphorbia lathyris]|uniref:protein YABBY 2-like n=1 Tax=Euphorbia lathyris TaxID=212925 RepID=UPI003313C7B4
MSVDNIASEHVCYGHCSFCNTNLAVDVPSNIMLNAVTVKCGHCANLLSFTLTPTHHHLHKEKSFSQDVSESSKCNKVGVSQSSSDNEVTKTLSVNGGLGKRQRAPSAYNKFIKEEIRRIKANNPKISHREAFSTAAKNWAHLPLTQFGLTLNANMKDMHKQPI